MTVELDNLLQLIKELWPQFQVTKGELLHPASSLVVNFYTNFVIEFREKVQFLAGPYYNPDEFNDHLEAEDRLFQTMFHIFDTFEKLKFLLSDIYDPTPIRTKNFFKICCHLLSFAETILEEGENLGSNILKMKENTNRLEMEHEEILLEIDKNAMGKSELLETNKKLLQKLTDHKRSHEQMRDLVEQNQKVLNKKIKEVDRLGQQLQNEEQEIIKLENKEKELSEQIVSETEYKNLLKTIENLENEQKSLNNDEINMDEILIHENDELLHYQDGRKRVPDVADFDLEIVKTVIELEEELKDLQIENDKLVNDKINPLKLVKLQNEKNLFETKQHLEQLSTKYQEMMKQYLSYKEECIQSMNKAKEGMIKVYDYNTGVIKTLSLEIEQLEINLSNIKKTVSTEYVKISEADAAVKEYFKEVLPTLNKFKK